MTMGTIVAQATAQEQIQSNKGLSGAIRAMVIAAATAVVIPDCSNANTKCEYRCGSIDLLFIRRPHF